MPFGPTTSTHANVSASTSEVTLFSAVTTAVEGRSIYNDSTAILYVKKATGVSTSSFWTKVMPDALLEFPQPIHRGVVTGLWSAANGAARTTEDS
jgi:hypothetical protein